MIFFMTLRLSTIYNLKVIKNIIKNIINYYFFKIELMKLDEQDSTIFQLSVEVDYIIPQ
jgi:hypothetical protein